MTGIKMAETTWPAIEHAFKENYPIVIPLGAECKEHGYHLPMNTDKIIADYLAEWVFDNYPVLIAPNINQNYFPAFVEYPGSSTLSFETSVNMIADMCTNWHKQGAQQFYVLNLGISTNRVLATVKQQLFEKGILFHFFDLSGLDQNQKVKNITQQKVGTHADEIETSILLSIKPEVVDLSIAIAEESPDRPGLTRDTKSTDKTVSVSGAWGNPILATREKGEIAIAAIKDLLAKDLELFSFPQVQSDNPKNRRFLG